MVSHKNKNNDGAAIKLYDFPESVTDARYTLRNPANLSNCFQKSIDSLEIRTKGPLIIIISSAAN